METGGMKAGEIDYQERLDSFAKYRKRGIDIAFRCNKCGKLVYQTDVLYGVGCRSCGSCAVRPATANLTWFGLRYCLFFNWFWNWYYETIKFKEC